MTKPKHAPNETLSETAHPRSFRMNKYVYPVLSRRAGGLSIGINLNPDKACNFDCIYCQVDRSKPPATSFVGLPELSAELRAVLSGLQPHGRFWQEAEFASLPEDRKIVKDVAFSGDGEPTRFMNFSEVIRAVVAEKERLGFAQAKVVLITNATGLDRPDVREGLAFLDVHHGEIWAKLDAGTSAFFRRVDRTRFPFKRILSNITNCAKARSIVIQSCFMRIEGLGPDEDEIDAYIRRLRDIREAGGRIHLVQIHTVARDPSYGSVSSLSNREVDDIGGKVQAQTGVQTACYYGQVVQGKGLLGDKPSEMRQNPEPDKRQMR